SQGKLGGDLREFLDAVQPRFTSLNKTRLHLLHQGEQFIASGRSNMPALRKVVQLRGEHIQSLNRLLDLTSRKVTERRVDRSRERLDRKSTRLNSSHVKISYAVFCLKKKKRYTD